MGILQAKVSTLEAMISLQATRLTSVLMRWRSLQLVLQSSADSFCIWFRVYTRQVLQLAGMQL
jgi:hypothetical protein